MLPTFRYCSFSASLACALLLGASGVSYVFLRANSALPPIPVPAERGGSGSTGVLASLPVTGDVWTVMSGRLDRRTDLAQKMAEPFRLAGTFSVENGFGEARRKAILDNLPTRQQFIVSEDDRIDDATVTKIYHDHVTLQSGRGTRDIWLDFASRSQEAPAGESHSNLVMSAGGTGRTNRFGCIQVNENRWQFGRKPLLDYYQELLDEPDRMVAVFDTMKPVRDDRGKITGYVVGLEGEREFFDAVGLKQGDIVRAVNSVPMTNRKRAEFFIDEFLKDNMSAVVLEVERGGQGVKQVYQLRQ